MGKQTIQVGSMTVHVYEETFSTSDTLTYTTQFDTLVGIALTVKKATASALILSWSVSGKIVTITASASSSETITIVEFGRR